MNDRCYIISYKLSGDSLSLIKAIKSYGTWAKITDNTWAVVTPKTATEIRDYLKNSITENDRLFVVRSGVEAAWSNTECSSEWLKKNI